MDVRSAAVTASVEVVWGLCFVLINASLPSPAPLLLAALRALLGGVLAGWVALRVLRQGGHSRAKTSWSASSRFALPSVALLIVLALTNVVVAFAAMYLAAGRAEAAVASIIVGGQPLILIAAGSALFGERLSGRTAAGIALAVLAAASPAAGTLVMRQIGPRADLGATTSVQFLFGESSS